MFCSIMKMFSDTWKATWFNNKLHSLQKILQFSAAFFSVKKLSQKTLALRAIKTNMEQKILTHNG